MPVHCKVTPCPFPLHNLSGLPHNSVERERVIVLHLLLIINDVAEDNNDSGDDDSDSGDSGVGDCGDDDCDSGVFYHKYFFSSVLSLEKRLSL